MPTSSQKSETKKKTSVPPRCATTTPDQRKIKQKNENPAPQPPGGARRVSWAIPPQQGEWFKGRRGGFSVGSRKKTQPKRRMSKQEDGKGAGHFRINVINVSGGSKPKTGAGRYRTPRSKSTEPATDFLRRESLSGRSARSPGPIRSVSPSRAPSAPNGNGLTHEQIAAFREVFDLFDSNGGGTIDAEEFDKTLQNQGINLGKSEIIEIMSQIDVDGSGEIDFEEFLMIMTKTEHFLEEHTAAEPNQNRENILFDALTNFMRNSALSQMGEIVGYYHTKQKRFREPHVVGHYAAGARLIGLTEKQLVQHFESIRAHNAKRDSTSPYAQPLPFVVTEPPSIVRFAGRRKPNSRKPQRRGKIKLKVLVDFSETAIRGEEGKQEDVVVLHKDDYLRPLRHGNRRHGWLTHRLKHTEVMLPYVQLKSIGEFASVTTDKIHSIRRIVERAKTTYDQQIRKQKITETMQHWKALNPECIHSDMLKNHFRKVFAAYNPLVNKRKLKA